MAAWSQLPSDLWHVVGGKLHVTADRIRFRSVCRAWRSLVPFPQPPWLMLAEDDQTPSTRGFFSVTQEEEEEEVYQFHLPEMYQVRCVGSNGTWLVTIDLQHRMRLLNPFSRIQIDLPSPHTLEQGQEPADPEPQMLRDCVVWKVILSSTTGQSCVAMAIHHGPRNLAVSRPGDASWAAVHVPIIHYRANFSYDGPMIQFRDAIFYNGQFYAINYTGTLVVIDLGDDHAPPKATLLSEPFELINEHHVFYLVEWMGQLLFVIRVMHDEDNFETYNLETFQVYTFDFVDKKWNELKDLGDYSLFLGFNTSVAVFAPQYPGLRKNCIYYTDNYLHGYFAMELPGGRDMGIFSLEDKTISLHYKGVSTSYYSPPLWIIPK